MKNSKKLILILILLIAVAAAAFGVHKISQDRAAYRAERSGGGAAAAESGDTAAEGQSGGSAGAEDQAESGTSGGLKELFKRKNGPLATVFFASDYQGEPGFAYPGDTLLAVLNTAKADGKNVQKVVMCGDYSNDNKLHDYQISPDEAIDEMRADIASVYPDVSGEKIMFIQGNHDKMTDRIAKSGLHEEEDYLVYVLNTENDFPWKQGKVEGSLKKVQKAAAAMKACFDELIAEGETRPVFIAGHVPLHFTARTSSKHTTGDNLYSSLIFDVVNEAGKSLDIIYCFGHDHSKGWDCYLGGSSVYKAPGETILIPRYKKGKKNTDKYSEDVLNFTYMNAGYIGYYMNCGPEENDAGELDKYHAADETLTGTVFEIYEDRIDITRYDAGGVHVLSHAGEGNPYKGGIDKGLIPEKYYSSEIKSPQTLARHN